MKDHESAPPKKLQAAKERCEQEKWSSPEKGTSIGYPIPSDHSWKHTGNIIWTQQVILICILQQWMKKEVKEAQGVYRRIWKEEKKGTKGQML